MQRIKNSEFGYLGNPSVKRDGVETQFTKEEVQEYAKCMKDPAYFARTYIKVISLDKDWFPLIYILIKKRCFIISTILDLVLF